MAQMTLGDHVAELDARGFSAFSTTQKERYANWAYFDVARAARFIEEEYAETFQAFAGDEDVSFTNFVNARPGSIIMIVEVTTGQFRPLEPMTTEEFKEWVISVDPALTANQGRPTHYYIFDEKIWLYPTCDKTRSYRILGHLGRPTELTSAQIPITDQQLDPAITHRALYYCHLRALEPQEAAAAAKTSEDIIFQVMGDEGLLFNEFEERVEPDTGWNILGY